MRGQRDDLVVLAVGGALGAHQGGNVGAVDVGVDQAHGGSRVAQREGQVDGHGGLANATLAAADGDHVLDTFDRLLVADTPEAERTHISHAIAIGALRYFLLKYTRTAIIAFDFRDALSFEGETGPYCQYATVRARNIFRKMAEQQPDFSLAQLDDARDEAAVRDLLKSGEGDDLWEVALLAGSLDAQVATALSAQEPAFLAKYAFELAQGFNLFYHRHHILSEADAAKRNFLLRLSRLAERQLVTALDLLGIEAPEKM